MYRIPVIVATYLLYNKTLYEHENQSMNTEGTVVEGRVAEQAIRNLDHILFTNTDVLCSEIHYYTSL